MIKAKVSTDYKDIERIFAGGSIQKEILKIWSTEADTYVFEAWRVLEMEGPLPLTITANGEPLVDYCIYGNTEQNGTPTPENPITPIGCGVKTENLFSGEFSQFNNVGGTGNIYMYFYIPEDFTLTLIAKDSHTVPDNVFLGITKDGGQSTGGFAWAISQRFKVTEGTIFTVKSSINEYHYVSMYQKAASTLSWILEHYYIMLNSGSTALPYEPYGYKLPILSNSTATNIYLGEVETTRRIKKLALTGEEKWTKCAYGNTNYTFEYSLVKRSLKGLCSHYARYASPQFDKIDGIYLDNTWVIIITDLRFTTETDFKSYLQQQYAAGTPVTVWYVLAEPETGIVNEPLMKVGDYADTVDSTQANVQIPTSNGTTVIDYEGEDHFITSDGYELVDKNQNGFLLSGSTLRPSKMYIKYKGR